MFEYRFQLFGTRENGDVMCLAQSETRLDLQKMANTLNKKFPERNYHVQENSNRRHNERRQMETVR
jgi:hypothetical protein